MASYKQLFVEALKDKNYNLSARQFFEKLQTDSMLRRLPGSTGRSTRSIDNFKAVLSKGGGMARLAKYEVVLHPPDNFTMKDWYLQPPERGTIQTQEKFTNETISDVSLQCNTVAMPGVDLQTQGVQYGSAPVKDMVTAHAYEGTITTSFYLDESLETKTFFELWQDMAVNPITHKAKYYNHYIGSMDIYQLGHKGRTYGVHVEEVYPKTIGQIEYAYETTDTLALLPIEFNYKKWKTIHPNELYG